MKNKILFIIQRKFFFSRIRLDNNNYKLLFNFNVVKNGTISLVLHVRPTFPSMVF